MPSDQIFQSGLAIELLESSHALSSSLGLRSGLEAAAADLGAEKIGASSWRFPGGGLLVESGTAAPMPLGELIDNQRGAPIWIFEKRGGKVALHPWATPVSGRPRCFAKIEFRNSDFLIPLGALDFLMSDSWTASALAAQERATQAESQAIAAVSLFASDYGTSRPWNTVREVVDEALISGFKALQCGLRSVNSLGLPRSLRDLIEDLPAAALTLSTVSRVHECLIEPIGQDSSNARKRAGAFFTPPQIVSYLTHEAVAMAAAAGVPSKETRVVDPAMGTGAFLVEAARQLSLSQVTENVCDLSQERRVSRKLVRQGLHGIDRDHTTVRLAQSVLGVLVHEPGARPVNCKGLRTRDALTLGLPSKTALPTDAGETWRDLFPSIFEGEPNGFDVVLGNPPWEELTVESDAFWRARIPEFRSLPVSKRRARIAEFSSANPALAAELDRLREAAKESRTLLTQNGLLDSRGDADYYKAFAKVFLDLRARHGSFAIVLPRSCMSSLGSAKWRHELLEVPDVRVDFCINRGGWMFPEVNPGYEIVLVVGGDSKGTRRCTVRSRVAGQAQLQAARPGTRVTSSKLKEADPLLCVPPLKNEHERDLYFQLARFPRLGDRTRPDFDVRPVRELDATVDSDLFVEKGTPVLNHRHVGRGVPLLDQPPYAYADEEATVERLLSKRSTSARRDDSVWAGMSPSLLSDPDSLPFKNERLAFRDVVHATNPRKLWATFIPAGVFLTNKAPYLHSRRALPDALYYLRGVLCSELADWWIRKRMVLSLNFFILNSLPVPEYSPSDLRCRTLIRDPGSREAEAALASLFALDTNYQLDSTAPQPVDLLAA